jgi:serine/threonine-protein kinase
MLGEVLLGKYKVSRLLDEGGMSKIYLARQTQPARDVVVKVLKEEFLGQSRAREHFRREIYITARFHHPYAVAYYDSSDIAGGPLLVMEYLRGIDLNALLHREGRLTPERAGRLLAQLCDVLQAAHDAGVVHRDVKPGNLMVLNPGGAQESIKLMDFGLAKMSSLLFISKEELVDFNLPPASGTPEYIAPEMVRGNDVDGRGDLYGVGVVLFEMLTGRRPFVSPTVPELLRAHAEERPPTFAALGLQDFVPPALETVVQNCLAKHPDERPQGAWELAMAYERALGRRVANGRVGVDPPATPRPPGSCSVPLLPTGDRHAVRQSFEANMPEAMALVKLKGFIYDLCGEVTESAPGLVRVRLQSPGAQKQRSPLFSWRGRGDRTSDLLQTASETHLELHMGRKDPARPNLLTITLVMRPGGGLVTSSWRNRCQQIGRDLQAYLMGR